MKKAVLFDLDGTLLDTTGGVMDAVRRTVEQLGLELLEEETLRKFVGPPMQLSFEVHYGMNPEEALKSANLFRDNYKKYSLFEAELYPGVLELLGFLKEKGVHIAVATNKSHDNAVQILKKFGIDLYCECMLGSDLGGKLKKADIIEECIRRMDIDRACAVYVGDSSFDSDGARQAGLDFIGVTYGFGFRNVKEVEAVGAVACCDSVAALKQLLFTLV